MDLKITHENKKTFFLSIFLFFSSCFFIFTSGFLYIDDNTRIFTGEIDLISQGRPLSHFILSLFTMSNEIIDIRPMPQIMLTLLVGLSSIVLMKNFDHLKWISSSSVTLLIFLSPTYLQNLSYSFDCITMGCAVFVSIITSFFFELKKQDVIYIILSFLFILCTYQPAINVSLCLFVTNITINLIKHDRPFYFFSRSFLKYGIALTFSFLIYKISMPIWFHPTDYSLQGSKLLEGNYIINIYHSMKRFYKFFIKNSNSYLTISLLFSLLFSLFTLITLKKQKSKITYIIIILFPILLLFCTCGVMLILNYPLVEARTMLGFGAALSCFYIVCLKSNNAISHYIVCLFLFITLFGNILVALSYGNVLMNVSKEIYADASIIAEKAFDVAHKTGLKEVVVVGTIPDSGYISKTKKRVKIINNLLLSELGDVRGGNFFSPLMMYLNTKKSSLEYTKGNGHEADMEPIISEGSFYYIKIHLDKIYIIFKEN